MGRVSLRTKARAGGAVPTSGCWIRRLNGLRESNFYGFHYCLFWPNSWLHPPKFLIIFVAWSLTTDNEVWSPIAMYEPVTSHLSLPWKGNEIGTPILFQEIWGCFDYIKISGFFGENNLSTSSFKSFQMAGVPRPDVRLQIPCPILRPPGEDHPWRHVPCLITGGYQFFLQWVVIYHDLSPFDFIVYLFI